MFEGKKLLITGAAGYLATNLVRLLRGTDCYIIRLYWQGGTLAVAFPNATAQIEDVQGDIRLSKTEQAAREVLSLPMYPELNEAELQTVIGAVKAFQEGYQD